MTQSEYTAKIDSNIEPIDILKNNFDAVVMLTCSDWYTEPRSNRYHYASRFAKYFKVIFVQHDLTKRKYCFQETEFENITILHVYGERCEIQYQLINKALNELNIKMPLVWINDFLETPFLQYCYAPFVVFHATEDYFSMESIALNINFLETLQTTVDFADLMICVTDELLNKYRKNLNVSCESIALTNGCDYSFWALKPEELKKIVAETAPKTALYQGGINDRLNYDLIENVIKKLSDWCFIFMGNYDNAPEKYKKMLKKYPNIISTGQCSIEEVRQEMLKASVGIAPFINEDSIYLSKPLKIYEYIACGLDAVSSARIKCLEDKKYITAVQDADSFVKALIEARVKRNNENKLNDMLLEAKKEDYDIRFQEAIRVIADLAKKPFRYTKLKVCVLYNPKISYKLKKYLEDYYINTNNNIIKLRTDTDDADYVNYYYFNAVIVCGKISNIQKEKLNNYHNFKVALVENENFKSVNQDVFFNSIVSVNIQNFKDIDDKNNFHNWIKITKDEGIIKTLNEANGKKYVDLDELFLLKKLRNASYIGNAYKILLSDINSYKFCLQKFKESIINKLIAFKYSIRNKLKAVLYKIGLHNVARRLYKFVRNRRDNN